MQRHYNSSGDSDTQPGFQNLDDPANLPELMRAVESDLTRNFVVDFNENAAWTAFDLSATSITALLDYDRDERLSTCWINVWYPYHHQALLRSLAQRYDFSPRLLALMLSDPKRRRESLCSTHQQCRAEHRTFWSRYARSSVHDYQAERGSEHLSEHSSISSDDSVARGNIYRIVDDLWHFSSVDFGRNYICVGYNSFYETEHLGEGSDTLPHCIRVWGWIVLCSDNSVISINEDPFPFADGRYDAKQQRILARIRRNLISVFRSLSKVEEGTLIARRPMTVLPIRMRLGGSQGETVSDAPGLLFYYLFENWQNSYTLVTRRDSRYSVELDDLRADMFKAPQLSHVDRLDNIGKELGMLKRHYQSYGRIIDRLNDSSTCPPTAVLQTSQIVHAGSQTSVDTVRPVITERESILGVTLPEAVRVRFKRLKDLIDLYALSEVEEYIKQKDAMIAMNFNLIAIKESVDVERLTRATFLLTKVSILFLPISLLTTYFGVKLVNVDYTLQEYWISFAVTLFVSWVALFVLGVFGGSLQPVALLRSGWQKLELAWSSILKHVGFNSMH